MHLHGKRTSYLPPSHFDYNFTTHLRMCRCRRYVITVPERCREISRCHWIGSIYWRREEEDEEWMYLIKDFNYTPRYQDDETDTTRQDELSAIVLPSSPLCCLTNRVNSTNWDQQKYENPLKQHLLAGLSKSQLVQRKDLNNNNNTPPPSFYYTIHPLMARSVHCGLSLPGKFPWLAFWYIALVYNLLPNITVMLPWRLCSSPPPRILCLVLPPGRQILRWGIDSHPGILWFLQWWWWCWGGDVKHVPKNIRKSSSAVV